MERTIRERLADLHRRIEAAAARARRDPAGVQLIIVTKNRAPAEIEEVLEAGPYTLAENRIQEALAKIKYLPPNLTWHFIGHLQRNKAREAVRHFAMIHSVDSLRLAEALQVAAKAQDKTIDVLLEINISGEESKDGLAPDEIEPLLAEIKNSFDRVKVRGLMTMAPFVADPDTIRGVFSGLRELRDRLVKAGYDLPHLSMGMTSDFEIAVEEGATMVRVGTAVFEEV